MKFHKDEGIPYQNLGDMAILVDAPIKVIRLSDGFVQYRKNKPKRGSEFWDKTKYKVVELIFTKPLTTDKTSDTFSSHDLHHSHHSPPKDASWLSSFQILHREV